MYADLRSMSQTNESKLHEEESLSPNGNHVAFGTCLLARSGTLARRICYIMRLSVISRGKNPLARPIHPSRVVIRILGLVISSLSSFVHIL